MKQKNQDLNNEICILKTRLNQEIDAAKKLAEERDSLKTALQIVTKDLMDLSEGRPISCSEQLSDDRRSQFKNVPGGEKTKKQKPRDPPQHVNHQNRFEPPSHEDISVKDSAPSSNADMSFTTVLVGDSMIKQIQGRRFGKKVGHRVVVKSFPGANTNNIMKHYLMPTVDKSPQQIILHVGTNDLRDHSPTVVAENISFIISFIIYLFHTIYIKLTWKEKYGYNT